MPATIYIFFPIGSAHIDWELGHSTHSMWLNSASIERFFPCPTRAMMILVSIKSYFSWVLFVAVLPFIYVWFYVIDYVWALVFYFIYIYNYIHSLNHKLTIFLFISFFLGLSWISYSSIFNQLRLGHDTHCYMTCILSTFTSICRYLRYMCI